MPVRMTTRRPDQVPRQRWQLLFSRTEPLLRMRQQQVIEAWERVFGETGLPLSRSNAKRPRPRLQLAANLPIAVELRGEILEAYFDDLVPIDRIRAAAELLPEGLALVDAREVWHGYPSAASQVRAAEYEVAVRSPRELSEDDLRGAVVRLLGRARLPGMRRRGETQRRSDAGQRDLRPYIEDVEVMEVDEAERRARLRVVLRQDATGAGRPEDVVHALDVPLRIERTVRTRLLFVDTPPIAR
jgi:radical SAM-linked protein